MTQDKRFTDGQLQEIAETRAVQSPTYRPTVPALEELMFTPFPVLDHGFIRVIDYQGDDSAVTQAARISYGKGTKSSADDKALIRYMLRHHHATPFEMCSIKYHVKLPIFVARQWVRHRAAHLNEMSARYSILDNEFYIPTAEDMAAQSTTNRQGRGDILTPLEAENVQNLLVHDATRNYNNYEWMLNDPSSDDFDPNRSGLARELARMNLTLNTYTQWYWKADLRNLFNFLFLRADSHAQKEIRVYAEIMLDIVRAWVPTSAEAFVDYSHKAKTFSRMEILLMQEMLAELEDACPQSALLKKLRMVKAFGNNNSNTTQLSAQFGMSKRELTEFTNIILPGE